MPRRARWLGSIQRELQVQRQDHTGAFGLALVLWLVGSGVLAVALWLNQWQDLQRRADLQNETNRGLLDLRVTSHKDIVLDWGHWDPMYAHAGGEDEEFVAREVLPTPIIADGQTLLIVQPDGTMRNYPATPLSASLRSCLQQRLQRLNERTRDRDRVDGFGFHCSAGQQSAIGAATAIRASGNRGPNRGFLMHFSWIERPSYNSAVNRAFREISAAVQEQNTPNAAHRVHALSELVQPGHSVVLQGAATDLERKLTALTNMVLPWLGLNLLAVVGGGGALLGLRGLRLSQRRSDWKNRSRLRLIRQELPGPLLSQNELLEAINRDRQSLEGCWITALRMNITMFSGVSSRSGAHTHALGQLGERLQERPGTRLLALGEDSNLLLIFRPENAARPDQELQRMAALLHRLEEALSETIKLTVVGRITPLDRDHPRQQLTDLAMVLSAAGREEHPLLFLREGVAGRATELRQQLHIDFSVNQLVENLRDHRFALEPVVVMDERAANRQRIAYSEMLFRLPPDMNQAMTVQEVILSLERSSNVHLIDQLMLRKAIELLRATRDPEQTLGINLSTVSFGSRAHFESLLAQLRALPEPLRKRLVLEITETAIVEKHELWSEKLQQLRELGVRIAIDDFGVGFASIAYLFRFQADYLKLDLSYSQRLDDRNVDALVDFLLAYARHNSCELVLEGIETEQQLQVWHRRGVRLFQGYLFHESPDGGGARSAAV